MDSELENKNKIRNLHGSDSPSISSFQTTIIPNKNNKKLNNK